MFGKPAWFIPKAFGWGIHPVTWQGWVWLAGWLAVMLLPYAVFLSDKPTRWTEGFIWLTAMAAVMIFDVWQILAAMKPLSGNSPTSTTSAERPGQNTRSEGKAESELFYIGDEPEQNLTTKNYDFRLRR